jgi:putative DNA primase/helicase
VKRTRTMNGTDVEVTERLKPSLHTIKNTARLLRAFIGMDDEIETPHWMKGECLVNPKSTIAFRNGLVDCSHSQPVLVDREPRWFDHVVLPCDWAPDAECPRWMQALREWSGGDESWEKLLQRIFGYALLPHRRYAKWALFYGKVRSGKSTILRVLQTLVGVGAFHSTSLDDISRQFGLADLVFARVLAIPEVSKLDTATGERATRVLKQIIGGDSLSPDVKYQSSLPNVRIPAFPIMLSNEVPSLPNKGRGLSSKMLMVPFTQNFEGLGRPDSRNPQYDLLEVLMGEIGGIARWAVEGAMALEAEPDPRAKFPETERGREELRRYHWMNHPFDHFLENRFVAGPEWFTPTKVVWAEWVDWCKSNNIPQTVPRNMIAMRIMEESTWDLRKHRQACGGAYGLKGLLPRRVRDQEID